MTKIVTIEYWLENFQDSEESIQVEICFPWVTEYDHVTWIINKADSAVQDICVICWLFLQIFNHPISVIHKSLQDNYFVGVKYM